MRAYFTISGLTVIACLLLTGCGPESVLPKTQADISTRRLMTSIPKVGQPIAIKTLDLNLQPIPAGEFLMGSPSDEPGRTVLEGPQTHVRISKPFWIGRTEVTMAQWRAIMGMGVADQARKYFPDSEDPVRFLAGTQEDAAMYLVSWDDALAFCAKLNALARAEGTLPPGYEFTLPTEAEWEYSCRAGATTATYIGPVKYYGSNNAPALDSIAWYAGNSSVGFEGTGWDTSTWSGKQYPGGQAGVRRVAQRQPNAWGLHDMLGNVYEWCLDYSSHTLPGGSVVDPMGPYSGSDHMVRGGSWHSDAAYCRAASRKWNASDSGLSFVGFRLTLAPRPTKAR